eukprot:CAMPEP_0184971916 /NCGR_PEP_ID=MMETSP1098-20130426/4039_1 /TAXON_ID=89044 /ORGANISM="Spumella elongata, Strain CCAP 955/1" /LENGTH=100 /DNA_ID=CAMNT_0027494121 /DNA_START=107 /DNA_END=409 /DNA_ORIENTATION=-
MSEDNAARRINRTLTQKYDMGALRALQKLESDFLVALAAVYGVEEDEVPVELDLLQIYNSPEESRLGMLQNLLAEAPKDTSDIVNKLVEDMITVSNMPSK